MAPSVTQQTVIVRGDSVPVTIFEPGRQGPGSGPGTGAGAPRGDLLFLHGYARHPLDYRALIDEIVGRGWRVVAPFLYCNNALRRPPRHFWACAGLTKRTVQVLRDEGLLAPGAPAFGHSTGGAVALTLGALDRPPAMILAINPVQPSKRWSVNLMARSAWKSTKMAVGLAGEGPRARRVLTESSRRFYGNWFRDPRAAFELIGGLRGYTYDRLVRWYRPRLPCDVPTRVLYGMGDEFYPSLEGLEEGLRRVFGRFDLVVLESENSHEWLMIRQERAADELARFLYGDGVSA